jgi:hypothetical protein
MDNEGFSYQSLTTGDPPASSPAKAADDDVSRLVRSLRWDDKFFEREEGLVAVFDLDYAEISAFRKSVGCAMMLFPPVLIFGLLGCYPCMYRQWIDWEVYAEHVAITRDGIKYVKDKHRTGCGLACQEAGKKSKTVPFDKITDCDIEEPAGATCCCIDNVLTVVNVDTASGSVNPNGAAGHELTIAGLKEPHKFKQLVWAMKRANFTGQAVPSAAVAPSSGAMDRGMSSEETNAILRDIRSELIELNANIKSMKS